MTATSAIKDNTLVSMDGEPGAMEGVVVRTADNRRRVKLRVEDYRRALRAKVAP